MSCIATCNDTLAGLYIETWSGQDKADGQPTPVCSIDDNTDARHWVEVTNVKTYARRIEVRGVIIGANGNARFVGPISSNGYEWQASDTLYGIPGTDIFSHGSVKIVKDRKGVEKIGLEVEYQDVWNPKKMLKVNVPTQPLVFQISLI